MTDAQRLGDRYELGEELGRGGMAEVHLGHDVRLGRTVAIKTLRADLARDPTFQARFRREAQSAASLNHPAIVSVYDTGEDVVHGAFLPFIVMEYVEGQTLRELMNDGRRLLPERALEITAGVLRALEYSHQNGIIHRDIKPANVMLSRQADIKVMDFGIARAVADTSSTVTQTAAVIGTAQYLSPEQARGGAVDTRSDLYSTGVLLYELLTGRPPFIGDSPVAVAYQHVREDPVPPSQLDPDLPEAADAIVMKALAKNPDDRYQDAGEMRADIERSLAGRAVTAPAVFPTADTQMYANTSVMAPTEQRKRSGGRRRTGFVLLGLAVVAVFLLAALAGRQLFADEPKQVSVPDLLGLNRPEAVRALKANDLKLGSVTERFGDQPDGNVLAQDPSRKSMRDQGSKVDIVLSKGSQQVSVPEVVGQSRQRAARMIEDAGLQVDSVDYQDSGERQDTVLAADPSVGSSVDRDSTVDLAVASGANTVPDVTGQAEDSAEATLESAGFDVDVTKLETDEGPEGTVIDQSPGGGASSELASTVTITVAKAPPAPEPIPTETETVPPSTPPTSPTPSPSPTFTLPGG